jgi:tetratricopeptide (TPR) repeat protein/transcriptional regulator with XRE-family HTH domain
MKLPADPPPESPDLRRLEPPAGDDPAAGATLASLLRWSRQQVNLTQAELANKAGLGVRTIRDLELGRTRRPHPVSARLLAQALGLSGELRTTFERVAAGGVEMTWPARMPGPPRQLPPDVSELSGRSEQVTALQDLLSSRGQAPALAVLSGAPGVGKTALAVHVAHQLADSFPDGQLFVDLEGAGAAPRPALEVLAEFLRALGVEGGLMPAQLEERTALYRTLTANRRLLVLLDNAEDEAHVRPLLPGSAGCGVIVTSRSSLAGLACAHSLVVDVLEPWAAVELMSRILEPARVAAEPQAAAAVTALCGGLPLALRIAAARLAERPHWALSRLAERLADERCRLNELNAGDLAVRASFALSYRRLQPEERRAFRLLGLLAAPDLAAWALSALIGADLEQAELLAERLVEVHLLEVGGDDPAGQIRYRMHDLLRVFARELLEQEEPAAARAVAVGHFVDRCTALARRADGQLGMPRRGGPPPPDDEVVAGLPAFASWRASVAWLDAERPCLVNAALLAADQLRPEPSWQLAEALYRFFYLRGNWMDWRSVNEAALRAASRAGCREAEAQCVIDLGVIEGQQRRYESATEHFERALEMSRLLGSRLLEGRCLRNRGMVYGLQGHFAEAIDCHEQGLANARAAGDRFGETVALANLGWNHLQLEKYEQAVMFQERSLALSRASHERQLESHALYVLGEIRLAQGCFDQAIAHCLEALSIARDLGDRLTQGRAAAILGDVHRQLGQTDEALGWYRSAQELFQAVADASRAAEVGRRLAALMT